MHSEKGKQSNERKTVPEMELRDILDVCVISERKGSLREEAMMK